MRISLPLAAALVLASAARGQVISRVSVDGNGNQGNAQSGLGLAFEQRTVAISADGNVIAFASAASNLVAGDGNGSIDIFVVDRVAGTIERVSVDSTGIEADADCVAPAISADGNVVAFWSRTTNLVANDTNGAEDTFLHDRSTGITERVSVNTAGVEGDLGSYRASLSSDGMLVAFESNATNLAVVDTNKSTDIFLRDRAAGTTRRVSLTSSGTPPGPGGCFDPSISSDGSRVAFSARATDFVLGDTNGHYDVFVRDRVAVTTVRVSVDSSGLQGDSTSWHPTICADGSTVEFESYASNLVPGDVEGQGDVFVHELASGITERVSVDGSGNGGDGESNDAMLSADGKFVVFSSLAANLFANDTNGVRDVFLRDRAAGTTAALSVDISNVPSNGESGLPAISADATQVAFSSVATDLVFGDTNGCCDVFVADATKLQTAASWTNYGAGFPGTNGVPAFTASANPVLGATISLDAGNSSGTWSVGLVVLGVQSASIPTRAGGTLLVDPLLQVFLPLTPNGGSIDGIVPPDAALYGVSFFAQILEIDPGATFGISFSQGIELIFGR